MCIFSKKLFSSIMSVKPAYLLADIKIIPTPSDATVTITATGYTQSGNSIRVPVGTVVSYSVSKDKYQTRDGSFLVAGDTEVPVRLSEQPKRTLSIITKPADAAVLIVGDGYTSEPGAKSLSAPVGTELTYTVSDPLGQLSLTETGTIKIQEDTSINVSMRTKANITKVLPPDATVKINDTIGTYRELPCDQVIKISVTRDGYDPYTNTISLNNRGIVPDFVQEIELKETTYNLVVDSSPSNASLSVVVNDKTYTGTGRVSVNGILPGTSIKATATLSGYDSVTETFSMPASNYGKTLSLNETEYTVTITSTPANATIVMMFNGKQVSTGTGKVTAKAKKGTLVDYAVTYSGKEEVGNFTMPAANYSKSVVLDAKDTQVTIIAETTTKYLPAGRYRFIAVSGGGNGGDGTREPYEYADYNKCGGGGGGGSGRVQVGEFISSGEDVTFTIGKGGAGKAANYAAEPGGETIITGSKSGMFTLVVGGSGGKTGNDTGTSGSVSDTMKGGDGGCGGGAGGRCATKGSNLSSPGGAGGKGGYDGISPTYGGVGGQGKKTVTGSTGAAGGVGGDIDYTSESLAGRGGLGASSLSSALTTMDSFLVATEDTLYNAMSGGGGGGGTIKKGTYSYGGGGGGGGAWTAGGVASLSSVTAHYGGSGKGGDGAVLYARIAWS